MNSPLTVTRPLLRTLVDEHAVIQNALLVLAEFNRRLAKRLSVQLVDLVTLVQFLRQYADEIHHHTEEEILFESLRRSRSRSLRKMMGTLITQHVIGRLLVEGMDEAIKRARSRRRGWRSQFTENATAYHTLLSIHICDENNVFFPAAERELTKWRIATMRRRTPITIRKNKLESAVIRLSRKYVMKTVSRPGVT